ncbi:type I toxin-antitoxin system SymE family toxin [Buttiauxella sp. 3AFRM03]|nr:type I toxin-antitoxin system SymE family toxin [Buttiauxella sp. 3AFRM03]
MSKAQRRYIVGYVPNRGDTGTPNIHLKGKWLKEAGFETGAHLTVKIADGCIVLIKDSEEVDDLKHEQEALHQQLRDIKQANRDMKSNAKAALRGIGI